jgi:hypothetical protein
MVFASVSEIKVQYLLDINPILSPSLPVMLSPSTALRINSAKHLSEELNPFRQSPSFCLCLARLL